jgi:hypothetical protein
MSYNCTNINNTCNSLIYYCKKNYYIDQCTCIKNIDFYDMYCLDTTNIIRLLILIFAGLFFISFIFLCYTKLCILYKKNNLQQNTQQYQSNNTMIEIESNNYSYDNNSNLPTYEDISTNSNSNDSPPAYDNRSDV